MPALHNPALVRAPRSEEDFDGETVDANRTHCNDLRWHSRRVRERQPSRATHDLDVAERADERGSRPDHRAIRPGVPTREAHGRSRRRGNGVRRESRRPAAQKTRRHDGQRIRSIGSCSRSRCGVRAIAAVVGWFAVRRSTSATAPVRRRQNAIPRSEGHREHHGRPLPLVPGTGTPDLPGRSHDQRPPPSGPDSDAMTGREGSRSTGSTS
jgi:hypothetical protein